MSGRVKPKRSLMLCSIHANHVLEIQICQNVRL